MEVVIEKQIVPAKVIKVESVTPKKSATISNLSDIVDKQQVLIAEESAPIQMAHLKQNKSEYNAKFRPFSAYVYVSGNGFNTPKHLARLEKADNVREWFSEF